MSESRAGDYKAGGIENDIFILDGKRFVGFDAQAYLRDWCGFSDSEAVQYLVLLSREYRRDG